VREKHCSFAEKVQLIRQTNRTNDGTIHIKSTYKARYWKLHDMESGLRWIKASQGSFNINDYDMIFKAAKIGNYFTLQSLGDNGRLCRSDDNSTRFGTVTGGSVSEKQKK
jgi:hypothetical protein